MIQVEMHLLHEREEKLAIQMKIAQIEEEREGAESKRLELEQALEEFVRSTDKKGKLAAIEKKASLEQGSAVHNNSNPLIFSKVANKDMNFLLLLSSTETKTKNLSVNSQ